MNPLPLHEFHHGLGAQFASVNGCEVVAHYSDANADLVALHETAGVLDLSFRSRICLVGADRAQFLHGQVTNDVKKLFPGQGCYAAITTAKGKLQSDLNLFCLADELLLDFEPGLTARVTERLENYIVSDDVQIVNAAPHYGLLSVQGPRAGEVVRALGLSAELPATPLASMKFCDATLGEIYLANHARLNLSPRPAQRGEGQGEGNLTASSPQPSPRGGEGEANQGFDLFVPTNSLGAVADKLIAAAQQLGGRAVGWDALETARIEAGVPRFGADMDETNLPQECGLSRALNFNKGCYIGQEVLNRVNSFGQVTRELRGLRLAAGIKTLPARGAKLFAGGKEVGYVTSVIFSPTCQTNLALAIIRREANALGTTLMLADGSAATVAALPFT